MRGLRNAFVALVAVASAACGSITGDLAEPVVGESPAFFRAGAARVDLTPPPGYPMGGFSGIGAVGRGVWTRLYARAVHVQSPEGESLALVACDLWGMSAGLADRVAERLGEDVRTQHLSRDQLVLAATHTHHSPGNYSSTLAYNALASPKPGFDRALFEYYAERIHHAIAVACERTVYARVRYGTVTMPYLARNRSLPAFRENAEHEAVIAANAALPLGPQTDLYPDPLCYRAVDASVHVLRIERTNGAGEALALLGFAALHPTVLGSDAEVYSSDVFGVASLELERASGRLPGRDDPATVVALFNGAEGDVSADWRSQGRSETVRLGRILADGVRYASGAALQRDAEPATLTQRFAVVPMAGRRFVCEGERVRTASVPAIGVPALGGAEDGRTPEHEKGYVEGVTGSGPGGHGSKKPALELPLPSPLNPHLVTRLVDLLASPPDEVPLGVYTVGTVSLATVPGEATTMIGHRIRKSVGGEPTLIVGLANEYLSYFATPEEYGLQHYEGASTLWGTYSGALLVYELGRLAHAMPGTYEFALALPRAYHHSPGFGRTFGLSHVPTRESVLQEMEPLELSDELPFVDWTDDRPDLAGTTPHVTPVVSVEVFSSADGSWEALRVGGGIEDDAGLGFVTLVTKVDGDETTWRSYWTAPPGLDVVEPLRFHVRRCRGDVVHSEPFLLPR